MLDTQQGAYLAPGQPFQVERSCGPRACTHLALDQLVVPPILEHVACPAAHSALGTVIAIAAGAVERGILHGQLRAVGGLTCEVHTAGEGRNQKVRGSFPAGRLFFCFYPGHSRQFVVQPA